MAQRKVPQIPCKVLDQLLSGTSASATDQGGLLDQLKTALAERALNAKMDYNLAGSGGLGNSHNSYACKNVVIEAWRRDYKESHPRVRLGLRTLQEYRWLKSPSPAVKAYMAGGLRPATWQRRIVLGMTPSADGTRRRVFGVDVDVADQGEAVRRIMDWCQTGRGGVVVTPNLDHIVKLESSEPLRRAYQRSRLVLPDGWPLVWLARLDGGPLLDLVTGSDLVDPVCAAAAREGHSVFLFGSSPPILEAAARTLTGRHPSLHIAGLYSPPMGFDKSEDEKRKAVDAIKAAQPEIVFVALGAPKQEVWATEYFEATGAKAVLCVGAALDFIAGDVQRAPVVFRRLGMEWLWRALSEPRRLGGRYLGIMARLPVLTLRHFAEIRRTRVRPKEPAVGKRQPPISAPPPSDRDG
ncbi:MAG: glycosyl transferase [Rhodospirillales bacterium]|nr:glycosyl transferase [Rhodospirillales bacterium]